MKHAPKAQRSMTQVTHSGQIVSVNTCGPYKVESIHKNRYVTVFVDHNSSRIFLYPHRTKSEYPNILKRFLIDFREAFNDKFCAAKLRV